MRMRNGFDANYLQDVRDLARQKPHHETQRYCLFHGEKAQVMGQTTYNGIRVCKIMLLESLELIEVESDTLIFL